MQLIPAGIFARRALAWGIAVIALHLSGSTLVLAEPGSTGGNIGKQDKSVSGDSDSRSPSHGANRSRPSSGSGGGGYDGVWSLNATGDTCPETNSLVIAISSGKVNVTGFTMTVSTKGYVTGFWNAKNSGSLAGRLAGQHGSGTFKRNDGCVGHWTMSKQ